MARQSAWSFNIRSRPHTTLLFPYFCIDADGSSGGFIDVDYLQEESNQALIELKVMEEMLSSLDNQDGKNSTSAGHVKTSTGLDQPTHYGKYRAQFHRKYCLTTVC